MNKKIKKIGIIEFCYWYVGFNSLLMVFRYGIKMVMYSYILSLVILAMHSILCLFSRKHRKADTWVKLKLASYIFAAMTSFYFSVEFGIRNVTNCMSIFIVLVIMLKRPSIHEYNAFMNGLKLSLAIDLIYAGVELVIKLFFHYNITSALLFLLGLRNDAMEHAQFIGMRTTGLSWDPYVLGGCCAVSFFLFKNKYFKLYILLILISSQSRAGTVGVIAALVIGYWREIFRNEKLFILIFGMSFLSLPYVEKVLTYFLRGFSTSSVGYVRIEYIILIPAVLFSGNVLLALFGGAPGQSGGRFTFSNIPCMINRLHYSPYWTIESDWANVLYGRGLFGVFAYCYMYAKVICKQKNKSLKLMYIAIFFAGLGYYYDTAIYMNLLIYFTYYSLEESATYARFKIGDIGNHCKLQYERSST